MMMGVGVAVSVHIVLEVVVDVVDIVVVGACVVFGGCETPGPGSFKAAMIPANVMRPRTVLVLETIDAAVECYGGIRRKTHKTRLQQPRQMLESRAMIPGLPLAYFADRFHSQKFANRSSNGTPNSAHSRRG